MDVMVAKYTWGCFLFHGLISSGKMTLSSESPTKQGLTYQTIAVSSSEYIMQRPESIF